MNNNRHMAVAALLLATLGLVILLAGLAPAARAAESPENGQAASGDQQRALAAALHWLIALNQNADGGFGIDFATGEALSNVAATLDGIIAIAATGNSPAAPYPGQSSSPIAFLENQGSDLADFAASSGGRAGKVVLALTAANQDPRNFAGRDYLLILTGHLSPTGQFGVPDAFNQSLAILALASVRESVPVSATLWLKGEQAADGSWDDGFGTLQNADATALAVMALVAAGEGPADPAVAAAVQFLRQSQLASGGWEYGPGLAESANSTALVLQALSALGEDFAAGAGAWARNGVSPLDALLAYQSDSGAFRFFGADNFFATVQSMPAVSGRPLPLPSRSEATRQALGCLALLQDPASGGWEQFAGVGVDAGGTSRAVQAIAVAGSSPQGPEWTTGGGVDAVEALETLTPAYLTAGKGGRVGIVMQGVAAAGPPYDVSMFAGFDLPVSMTNQLQPDGAYDDIGFGYFAQGEAMLGLISAGKPVATEAINLLLSSHSNGDWGDADSNGITLNVLSKLGVHVPAAINNLRLSQIDDGGWGFGDDASVNSTSEVIQGLVAAGVNPFAPEWSKNVEGRLVNPAEFVLGGQETNGCWANAFGPGDDPSATTDAVMALTQEPGWNVRRQFLPLVLH